MLPTRLTARLAAGTIATALLSAGCAHGVLQDEPSGPDLGSHTLSVAEGSAGLGARFSVARAERVARALEREVVAEPVDIAARPTEGALQVMRGEQAYALPLLDTDVEIDVAGPVATISVSQLFTNPFDEPIEAVYVFPLPDDGAVDRMTMVVGDRVIAGEIHRREEARQIYEQARERGQTAALLEQERPNIFTQSLANILPGETIEVEIRVVAPLHYDDGEYSLHFPMTVGPRFMPGAPTGRSGGGIEADTTQVPDASRISPALAPAGRSGHDIHLAVHLDTGLMLEDLRSETHEIEILGDPARPGQAGAGRASVELATLDTLPNKDFELSWRVASLEPATGLLTSHDGELGHFSLLIEPPAEWNSDQVVAKEMVFVLDASCSMSGEPMAKAKEFMRVAMRQMNPQDTFQIIRFSESASPLSRQPLPNTPANVRRGLEYVEQLHGSGGTMMIEGIRAALDYPHDPSRLRLVLFLTDGYIGNETQILGAIEEKLEGSRLFSMGLGSSPNRYLLERMAEVGRGTVQYALPDEDPVEVADLFYDRIANPLLRDIEVDWGDLPVMDETPRLIPDLFAGQPLQIHGRYAGVGDGVVTVRGILGDEPVAFEVPVSLTDDPGNDGIASMWARAQIRDRMSLMYRNEDPILREEVIQLSLDYEVMSKWTSFVAVDRSVRTDGDPTEVDIASELPDGMSADFLSVSPNQPAPVPTTTSMPRQLGVVAPGRGRAGNGAASSGSAGEASRRTRSGGSPPPMRRPQRTASADPAPEPEAVELDEFEETVSEAPDDSSVRADLSDGLDFDGEDQQDASGAVAPDADPEPVPSMRFVALRGGADRAVSSAVRREVQRLARQLVVDFGAGTLRLTVTIDADGRVRITPDRAMTPGLQQLVQRLQLSAAWNGQAAGSFVLELNLD